MRSQITLHGGNPDTDFVELWPRKGEDTLRTEDIVSAIQREGKSLALVMLSGIQYYTGQLFDMETITAAAHRVGALCGFDCAHAAGNVPLRLHEWGCDFAVWCSYKYLNSGPGGIGGLFIHEKHHDSREEHKEGKGAEVVGKVGNEEQGIGKEEEKEGKGECVTSITNSCESGSRRGGDEDGVRVHRTSSDESSDHTMQSGIKRAAAGADSGGACGLPMRRLEGWWGHRKVRGKGKEKKFE